LIPETRLWSLVSLPAAVVVSCVCLVLGSWLLARESYRWDVTAALAGKAIPGAWPDGAYCEARLHMGRDIPELLGWELPRIVVNGPGFRLPGVPAPDGRAARYRAKRVVGRVFVCDISSASSLDPIIGFEVFTDAGRYTAVSYVGIVLAVGGVAVLALVGWRAVIGRVRNRPRRSSTDPVVSGNSER
jgi:hypothetical protein